MSDELLEHIANLRAQRQRLVDADLDVPLDLDLAIARSELSAGWPAII